MAVELRGPNYCGSADWEPRLSAADGAEIPMHDFATDCQGDTREK